MKTQSFRPFPRLPAELRLKIYSFALSEPTIITFNNRRLDDRTREGTNVAWGHCKGDNHIFVRHRPVPSLFHVCAESRAVCLQHHTQGFEVFVTKRKSAIMSPCTVHGHYHDGVNTTRKPRCRHENTMSSGKLKHIYWNPNVDIIHMKRLPITDGGIGEDGWDDSKTAAYLWADYHWCSYKLAICGIRRVAMSLVMFKRWYRAPRQRIVRGVEVVYVLLNRQVGDGDQEWDEHVKWFGRWFAPHMKSLLEEEMVKADPLPFDTFQLKLVGLIGEEGLEPRDLLNAIDWVEDTTGTWSSEDQEFQKQRYPEIFR
ncbi:hypothetical protein ONS96_004972 [Cadophora gregata f. sp. sojae]|nr:hypothetical protein ONS96_004972 [Cadophora gregata f. sp. sojae]